RGPFRRFADAMSPKGESDTRMGDARGPFRGFADAMSPKGESDTRMGGARGPFRGPRVEEVFEYFPRLRERIAHRGRHLSGGEQQMLGIGRALVARPSIMLVDEPTEGLAPMLVQSLTEILAAINRRGTTILLVEQALEVALTLAHRVYVMDQGRIQFEGTPDDLRRDPAIQQRFLGV